MMHGTNMKIHQHHLYRKKKSRVLVLHLAVCRVIARLQDFQNFQYSSHRTKDKFLFSPTCYTALKSQVVTTCSAQKLYL